MFLSKKMGIYIQFAYFLTQINRCLYNLYSNHAESTGFYKINEIKQRWACSIFQWVTINSRYCKQFETCVSYLSKA